MKYRFKRYFILIGIRTMVCWRRDGSSYWTRQKLGPQALWGDCLPDYHLRLGGGERRAAPARDRARQARGTNAPEQCSQQCLRGPAIRRRSGRKESHQWAVILARSGTSRLLLRAGFFSWRWSSRLDRWCHFWSIFFIGS